MLQQQQQQVSLQELVRGVRPRLLPPLLPPLPVQQLEPTPQLPPALLGSPRASEVARPWPCLQELLRMEGEALHHSTAYKNETGHITS